jgi:hypothetical protein
MQATWAVLRKRMGFVVVFALSTTGVFAARVGAADLSIFNSELILLLRTASLIFSPSKPAMLGEWSLHPLPDSL